MSINEDEKNITDRLLKITERNLNKNIKTAGTIPWTNEMRHSSIAMKPFLQLYQNSPFEKSLNELSDYIMESFKFRFP
ncbi:MAG: hypothetical protein JEY91_04155 [Spirochaetaceae bacterium]|nr:hypothetical protein [Spirochaetaceae bacterium]